MSRFFKTVQRESGPFKKSNNLLTIDIDDQGVTDFADSYLDFEVMFKAGAAYQTQTIQLGNPVTKSVYSGGAMLKNIRLESDNVGLVEEIRFQNRYCETMRAFNMTEQEVVSSQIRGENEVILDPVTNRGHIHVPLSQVLGCGESVWPNGKMGMSHLRLELEDVVPWSYKQLPGVKINQAFADITAANLPATQITSIQTFASLAQALTYFQPGVSYALAAAGQATPATGTLVKVVSVTCAGTAAAPADAVVTIDTPITAAAPAVDVTNIALSINAVLGGAVDCSDIPGAAAAANVAKVTAVGGTAVNTATPWIIGNVYTVGYTIGVSSFVTSGVLLTSAANAGAAADWDLTFTAPLFTTTATVGTTGIFVSTEAAGIPSTDFEVYSCNLVSSKLLKDTNTPLAFKTQVLETVTFPAGLTDYRRQVDLPQNCSKIVMLSPLTTSLLSTRDTLVSYRNSINSIDTTSMDVLVDNKNNSSIYYDRLINQLENVASLQPLNGTEEVVVIAESLALTNQNAMNVIEFRLQASGNMAAKTLYFFKTVMKAY